MSVCRLALLLSSFLFTFGCSTYVPVVPHARRCDASAELLTSCAKPKELPNSATFENMVDTMREDRQALLECGARLEALRDSLNRCNRQSEEINRKIDEINRTTNQD